VIVFYPENMGFWGRIFFLIGIGMAAAMIYFSAQSVLFLMSSVECRGRITGYEEKVETDSEGLRQTVYYPDIEFTDSEGKTRQFRSDIVMKYEVLTYIKAKESDFKSTVYIVPDIKIRYNPDKPEEVSPARSFFDIWGMAFAAGFFAFIFLIVGRVNMWFHKKGEEGAEDIKLMAG